MIDQGFAMRLGPCPQCGSALVERPNKHTGVHFIGCSQWPDCDYTLPIPAHEHMRRAGASTLPGFE